VPIEGKSPCEASVSAWTSAERVWGTIRVAVALEDAESSERERRRWSGGFLEVGPGVAKPESEDEDGAREVGACDLFFALPRSVVCLREGRLLGFSPSSSSSMRTDIFIMMLFCTLLCRRL
jgi:hypothetical protein